MCDTLVALPGTTAARTLLFGKNSDRQRNEAQTVDVFPSADYVAGATLNCTYVTIPQVRRTHAVLLCRPFWMWGAEMGSNEYGVAIGNEALFSRSPPPQTNALTGMDMVRLGLERAPTAADALRTMTELLEEHGQGGNCGHLTPSFYNNGFLIADPNEAYVLETIGKEWMVQQVRGLHTISNAYSINQEPDWASVGLAGLLQSFGWTGGPVRNCAEAIGDNPLELRSQAHTRQERSASFLSLRSGQLNVADFARILRDHGATGRDDRPWSPQTAVTRTICMHAGSAERPSQTTGALISEVRHKEAVHWVTGTAATCISIFKPVILGVPIPNQGPLPSDRYDSGTLWWRHEWLHRAALMGNFPEFLKEIQQERDALEVEFRARVAAVLNGGSATERAGAVAKCWQEADELEERWFARLKRTPPSSNAYHAVWLKMNRVAGIDAPTLPR